MKPGLANAHVVKIGKRMTNIINADKTSQGYQQQKIPRRQNKNKNENEVKKRPIIVRKKGLHFCHNQE